jgi:hypothetical protein
MICNSINSVLTRKVGYITGIILFGILASFDYFREDLLKLDGLEAVKAVRAHNDNHASFTWFLWFLWLSSFTRFYYRKTLSNEESIKLYTFLKCVNVSGLTKKLSDYLPRGFIVVARKEGEESWLHIFCFRPSIPSVDTMYLDIYSPIYFEFLSSITAICNPASTYICIKDYPDMPFKVILVHLFSIGYSVMLHENLEQRKILFDLFV